MLDLESMSLADLKAIAKQHNIKNISKLKLPPWFASPIAYPIGATSTMDKITHSTTIIIKLFLLSFKVLLTL